MMPYADRLGRLSAWFVQLWAESLGKGGEGTTPIAALGPLDQHSQLQLFMDGPREHLSDDPARRDRRHRTAIDADLARAAGVDRSWPATAVGDVVAPKRTPFPKRWPVPGRPVRTFDIANSTSAPSARC